MARPRHPQAIRDQWGSVTVASLRVVYDPVTVSLPM